MVAAELAVDLIVRFAELEGLVQEFIEADHLQVEHSAFDTEQVAFVRLFPTHPAAFAFVQGWVRDEFQRQIPDPDALEEFVGELGVSEWLFIEDCQVAPTLQLADPRELNDWQHWYELAPHQGGDDGNQQQG